MIPILQRAVDRFGRACQSEPAGCDDAERDDHSFVVVEHQRRETEAWLDAVSAADAALPFDRNAQFVQRGDVAPNRPPVDLQPVRDLAPGRERLPLQELE